MERKKENLTAVQGHDANKNQRANQSQATPQKVKEGPSAEMPRKPKQKHLKSSQTEGNTLRKGKSTSKNRNRRGKKSTPLKNSPMHCNAEGAGNQGRNHRKTTRKTNRGNQHQPMQQQQKPLQQHEKAKNTRSWRCTDDHRVCRRPTSWHPCPGGGKGSYWACCCLHHTRTFRVASPEGGCPCQLEQNTSLEEGKALPVMPRRTEG